MTKKIAFIFPGQGSQKIGMGQDFYDNFREAKDVFQEVDEILQQNLSQLIFSGDQAELTKTQNTQPALMVVSLAIMRVITQQNNKKINDFVTYVAGHSLGEYSALSAANAMSLADTAKILRVRGEAMAAAGQKVKGTMAAIIGADIKTAEQIVSKAAQDEICEIANDNSAGQIVISGNVGAINRAVNLGSEFGVKRILPLPVSGAFHSTLVKDAATQVQLGLENIILKSPIVPIIANVTADLEQDPATIKNLLIQQVTSRVRWRESVLKLQELGITDIVEIGSGAVLTGLGKRIAPEIHSSNIANLADVDKFINHYF